MLLERLLGGLDVSVRPFAVCEITRGAALELADDGSCEIHYVLGGAGTVSAAAVEPTSFESGSVLVIPRRALTRITPAEVGDGAVEERLCATPARGLELIRRSADGRSPGLLTVSGVLEATVERRVPLFAHLRRPLVVACHEDADVHRAFEVVVREQASTAPGAESLVRFAMTTVVVLVLRALLRDGDDRVPWLRALTDERLGPVLATMVDAPGDAHSVESLASIAGMSRSSFAAAFQEAFGLAPMEMVRAARIRKAAGLLRSTSLSVEQVATRVGYASRSQFTRAFKAEIGRDPSSYRRG